MSRLSAAWVLCLIFNFHSMAQDAAVATPDQYRIPGIYGSDYQRGADWIAGHFKAHQQHGPLAYLGEHRSWERLYIWVPQAGNGPYPCIVVYYGGGWGGKEVPMNWVKPLIERGYAIAIPDYALYSSLPNWQCMWDGAAAVRYLRAHAEKLNIDPERMGVMGNSAGGWLVQEVFFEGPNRVRLIKNGRMLTSEATPAIHPEQSVRVQAVVSDWGVARLYQRNRPERPIHLFITADDPPLLAPFGGNKPAAGGPGNPVLALQALGVPARGLYGYADDPHLPGDIEVIDDREQKTVWTAAIADFFDEHVKNASVAIAPELRPYGGPIPGPTAVTLLNAHPKGRIYYTLDGTDPGSTSAVYDKPVTVTPGQTLKAIVVREGLKPSRVVTAVYRQGPPIPRIVGLKPVYEAKVGQPFEIKIQIEDGDSAELYVGGIEGPIYTLKDGLKYGHGGKLFSWFSFDEKTGILQGVPKVAMVCPLIVGSFRGDAPDTNAGGTAGSWSADTAQFSILIKD